MAGLEAYQGRHKALGEVQSVTARARAASTPTAQVIPAEAKELGVKWEVEIVSNGEGGKLHWVGDRAAKKVVLWFHGGGFALSISRGSVIFWVQSQQKLAASGKNVVLAFLEYGLTPEIKYPTQYIQGIQALSHILSLGYKPSDIVIGGESAGGNMALAVISSIAHPHPKIPSLTPDSPLKGVVLMSPWVSFSTDTNSFKENKDKDIDTVAAVMGFAADFATAEERDNYSEPIRTDSHWWKGVGIENALMLVGDQEMFCDDVTAFARTLDEAGVNLKFFNCPRHLHIESTLNAQAGTEPGLMSTAIWDWLDTVF